VHSLDSIQLATRLDRFAGELNRRLPILLECNISGETSKFGFNAWDENQWERLADQVQQIWELPNLELRGLMTLAPYFENPERARPFFVKMSRLRDNLTRKLPPTSVGELSMGMSGDFEVAVQEGATIVRIGQAILGPRMG
jgi:pyridoxal phosphate enzyme (YggS family)